MKCVAIVNTNPGLLTKVEFVDIEGESIPMSLVQYKDSAPDKLPSKMVLVRKNGFSVNYRDKSLCLQFHEQIKDRAPFGYIPIGSEFVGTVEKIGRDVTGLRVGDKVICNNSYPDSGFSGLSAGVPSNYSSKELDFFHYGKLVKIPPSMPDEVAASFSLNAQTAYSMIRKARIRKNDRILVTSASSNTSLFLISSLVARGFDVAVITTKSSGIERLYQLGVKRVFFFDKTKNFGDDSQDWNLSNERYDIIFDPFYDIYFPNIVLRVKDMGRYLSCGCYNQFKPYSLDETPDLRDVIGYLIVRNISLIGSCLGNTQDLKNALADFDREKFHVIIDSVFSDNISAFMNRSFNDGERFGKVSFLY